MPTESPLAGGSFHWIRADRLSVDSRFERPISKRKVRKIVNEFDPDAIGVLYASKRADGSYVILDGQHRWLAVLDMGWGDQKIPVHVYEGLDLSGEAKLFREYNALRTRPRPLDLHRAAAVEGSDRAIAIDKALAHHGLEFGTGPGLNRVQSVGSLEQVYDNAGERVLRQTLTVAQRAWGSDSTAFMQDTLIAIAVILARHGSTVDVDRLIRVLHKAGTPHTLVSRARIVKCELGNSSHRVSGVVAQIIVGQYNQRLPEEKRIAWELDRSGPRFWSPDRTVLPTRRAAEPVDPDVARRIAAGGRQP